MTHCFRCNAIYDETIEWDTGFYRANCTSTDSFVRTGSIKSGNCPICRKPPQLEEEPKQGVPM